MLEIEVWMKCFTEKLRAAFGEKLEFIGLQGSYGRGEATESSDIDVVVIFSELAMSDLERYKDLIGEMPHREKICGFVSGRNELTNWDKADLFQFYHDTAPYFGSINHLLPLINRSDVKRAVLLGVEAPHRDLLAARVMAQGLSVRALEKLVAGMVAAASRKKKAAPAPESGKADDKSAKQMKFLADRMQQELGTKVALYPSRQGADGKREMGRIVIEFFDNEDLSRLLETLNLGDLA